MKRCFQWPKTTGTRCTSLFSWPYPLQPQGPSPPPKAIPKKHRTTTRCLYIRDNTGWSTQCTRQRDDVTLTNNGSLVLIGLRLGLVLFVSYTVSYPHYYCSTRRPLIWEYVHVNNFRAELYSLIWQFIAKHFCTYSAREANVMGASSRVVRWRRRLSPPAWVAAPSLCLGHLFCVNPWETIGSLVEAIAGKPRWGTRGERRATSDLEWNDSRY